jgi:hypothetical protein
MNKDSKIQEFPKIKKKGLTINGSASKFILVGFLFLSFSILLEKEFHELPVASFVITFLGHFGIGLLVIGILSIIIETSHWLEYFKDRLAEIVVESKYLEKLSPEELNTLQTEALKAYFKDKSIAGKDGFLQYYQRNIQKFVASPFRTNMQSEVRIEYWESDQTKICVHEEMTWECRSSGQNIQEFIQWEPNEGEFEKVAGLSFAIQHPRIPNGRLYYEKKDFKNEWKTRNDGLNYPLKDFLTFDGLKVTIISDVIVSKNKFLAWRMAHPSRGISLAVRYPQELTINKELFGLGEDCTEIDDKGKGYYKLSSQKWILPDEGIVYELV